MEMLRADAEAMRKSLEAVQQRITELEKEGSR
jgi:DNA-binding Lrp family transcriptional regulator